MTRHGLVARSVAGVVRKPMVGRPGSNRRRPAWQASWALAGQGFFGGGSGNGIRQSPQHGEVGKGSHHHRGLHCGSSCPPTSCSRRASGPCRRPTPSGPSKPIRQSEGSKRRSPARCETEDEISTPCADTSARGTRPWMPDLRIQGSAPRAELPSGRSVALVARTLLGSSVPWTLIDGFRARQSASPAWASSARDCCS